MQLAPVASCLPSYVSNFLCETGGVFRRLGTEHRVIHVVPSLNDVSGLWELSCEAICVDVLYVLSTRRGATGSERHYVHRVDLDLASFILPKKSQTLLVFRPHEDLVEHFLDVASDANTAFAELQENREQ